MEIKINSSITLKHKLELEPSLKHEPHPESRSKLKLEWNLGIRLTLHPNPRLQLKLKPELDIYTACNICARTIVRYGRGR